MFVLANISCFNALRDINGRSHTSQELREAGLTPRGNNYAENMFDSDKQLNADDRRFISFCLRQCRLGKMKEKDFHSMMKNLGIKNPPLPKRSSSSMDQLYTTGQMPNQSRKRKEARLLPRKAVPNAMIRKGLQRLGLFPSVDKLIYPNLYTQRDVDKAVKHIDSRYYDLERELGSGETLASLLFSTAGKLARNKMRRLSPNEEQAIAYATQMLNKYGNSVSDAALAGIQRDIQRM